MTPGSQIGQFTMFRPVFGTATLPTSTSVAFSRDKGGLLTGLWHGDPSYKYLRGIPAWRTASRPVHDRQLTDALAGLRHGDPAHRYLRGIPAWRRGSSGRSLARLPCPQVPQRHPRVAKSSSDRSSARQPYPQVLQSHLRVAKRSSDRAMTDN